MRIGIGSYAMFWEFSDLNPSPLSILEMVEHAATLGCEVFQICDDPRVEELTPLERLEVRERAEELDIELELGTRTIDRKHVRAYLDLANDLGVRLLRSMIQTHEIARGVDAVVSELRMIAPTLERRGITLALETYEQVPTDHLLGIISAVASPFIGVCLDPANCVPNLELPRDVIDACADRTVNLHVKDFRFDRQKGWVGFTYSGAPLGEGILDLDHELSTVFRAERNGPAPNAILEHWLPWAGDIRTSVEHEREWTVRGLEVLRAWRARLLDAAGGGTDGPQHAYPGTSNGLTFS